MRFARSFQKQLKAAAQATAMADRLQARKKQAAVSQLNQKLALIKQTSGDDPAQLAKQVLKVRAQRRALEQKLGIGAVSNDREF